MRHLYTKGKKITDLYAYLCYKHGKGVVWSLGVDGICGLIQDELEKGSLWVGVYSLYTQRPQRV